MRRVFPEHWEAFVGHLNPGERGDVVTAYGRRLADPDPAVHMPAAIAWRGFDQKLSTLLPASEDLAPSSPRTLAVARIAQHCVRYEAFLGEGELLQGVDRFRHVPGVIVHGRYDMIAPADGAIAPACEALRHQPGIRVVLTSGYAQRLIDEPDPPGQLLNKPYRKKELAALFAKVAPLAPTH